MSIYVYSWLLILFFFLKIIFSLKIWNYSSLLYYKRFIVFLFTYLIFLWFVYLLIYLFLTMHISVVHFISICILANYTYERWSHHPPSHMIFCSVTLPGFQQNMCSMFPHLESGWTCGCLTNTDWHTWCFLSSEAGISKRCSFYLVLWSTWVGVLRSRLPCENLTTLRLSGHEEATWRAKCRHLDWQF